MIRKIALLSLFVFPVSGNAATWVSVSSGGDSMVYVDSSSIKPNGPFVKFWVKHLYGTPQYQDYVGKQFSSLKSLNIANCSNGTMTTKLSFYYDTDGNVVYNMEIKPALASFTEIIPDTVGEDEYKFACKATLHRKKNKHDTSGPLIPL